MLVIGLLLPTTGQTQEACLGQVTYVTGGTLYLDRGRLDGLEVGMQLPLSRQEGGIATIEVKYLSDHRAVAGVVSVQTPPEVGDVFSCPPPQEERPAQWKPKPSPPPIPPEELPQVWTIALSKTQQPMVVQEISTRGEERRFRGEVGTDLSARSYFGYAETTRFEQRFSLAALGEVPRIEGLRFAVRGHVEARHVTKEDLYLPEKRVYPLFREAALAYRGPESGFFASLGRFSPESRLEGPIDGGEIGWRAASFTLSAYGGLKPGVADLLPRSDHQNAGLLLAFHPFRGGLDGMWRLGWLSAFAGGSPARNALSLDSTFAWGEGFSLQELATVSIATRDEAAQGKRRNSLADLSLRFEAPFGETYRFTSNARYQGRPLFFDVSEKLPEGWTPFLLDRRRIRVDLSLRAGRGSRMPEPYAYWEKTRLTQGRDTDIVAAGVAWHRRGERDAALDLQGEYGFEFDNAHRFDFIAIYTRPILSEALHLDTGIDSLLTFVNDDQAFSWRHLLHLRLLRKT
ncbi:MAG: hypothetical protein D6795_19455, partial [Deltaproteobacteria bacterium]